ncbi:MAG: Ig-like domain-containing protein, partial [Phototrophicaceae bacterium]
DIVIGDTNDPEEEETPTETACPAPITFEGLAAGTILSNQLAGITITTHDAVNHPAMIFDTSNPTGGDTDLGTPHSDFGGPGHGEGGALGEIGENSEALGNVIIISEDADSSDPDDNASGGEITFTFDYAVNMTYMYFLDQDNGGVAATVTLYDQGNSILKVEQVTVPTGSSRAGDNGVYRVDLNTVGVYKMVATLPGSGAIASVIFCDETASENGGGGESSESLGGFIVPSATTASITDVSASSRADGSNKWRADVTVTVTDNLGNPIEGAEVVIDFSRGGNDKNCTTDANGECTVTTNRINTSRSETVATIDTVNSLGSLSYDASGNSTASITVNQP